MRKSADRSWWKTPPAFVRFEAESWTEAIERDAEELIARYRELPSIERYFAAINPRREPDAARIAVLAAFDAAHLWTDVLAKAWRERYPAWSDAIDEAVGLSSLQIDAEAMEAVGQRLGPAAADGSGRYELLERIGRGSSGLVFRGVDHVFVACGEPGEVALKVISCAAGDVSTALREAGNARRISHGGVARILDAGRLDAMQARHLGCDDPAIFIVQEFVRGQPLWIWKACHPERDVETCQWIVASIREALDACHESGISHGDLTPANVLIEPSGRTRIIDFGGSVRSLERGDPKARRHDHERLEAISRWLLRDLRRARPGPDRRRLIASVMALVGLGILAVLFLPEPSRSDPGKLARYVTRRPHPTAPLPDVSLGEYQIFKQDGRVILIPGGTANSDEGPRGNRGGTTSEPSIGSVRMLDRGMVTIRISEEEFHGMFGESTGEVTREGLAVYRMPKERVGGEIAPLGPDRMVVVPSGSTGNTETPALPAEVESPENRVPREVSPDSRQSRERDAFISVVFGGSSSEPGAVWREALARSLLLHGPVAAQDRGLRIALADRIKHDAEAQRKAGQAHPGLELLAAMAFLSADVNAEALRLALQVTSRTMRREQRDLAEIVQAIATARMGTYFGGVVQADIEEFAQRHAAPGLARYPLDP